MLIEKRNPNDWGGNKDVSKNIPFPQAFYAYKHLLLLKVHASRLLLSLSEPTESTVFSMT